MKDVNNFLDTLNIKPEDGLVVAVSYGPDSMFLLDLLKNKYCFEHHIPLIRIPYNVEYNLNDLKLETTRFLLTPENEEQYY